MSRAPSDLEPRQQARFTPAQRDAILLRQAFKGADEVWISCCDECEAHIARLGADGKWERLRPICFDHSLARGLYGKTTISNGRAICDHPFECHKAKSAEESALTTKADKQGGRIGQYARRQARKRAGKKPLLQGQGFKRNA